MPAKIAIIYYSTYGHVHTLAEAEAKAAKAAGAEVDLYQFPEVLSEEIRGKMHAAPRSGDADITAEKLAEYDGFLFGFPTRYGRAPAAVSSFFDATGGLWAKGGLWGKFGGVFTSTASQHGGQETTALTTVPFFAHHGISFVPIGYAATQLTDNSEIVGGSAYGAAGIAGGDGSRQISEKELQIAEFQGKSFANLVNTFVAGKQALASSAAPSEAPAAAKALPATAATSEPTPYQVDSDKAAPVTTAAAAGTAAGGPAPEVAPAATPAATPAVGKTPVEQVKQQKKSSGGGGGFFCCGGKASNYDS